MNYTLNNFKKKINNHLFLASMVVFCLVFTLLSVIYFVSAGDPLPGDHYFHLKYAYLLRTTGLEAVNNFDWISPAGEIGNGHRYEVNLFQVSLIPFTFFSDWLMALHIIDAFYASATIAVIYYIMRKSRVKYPLFFTFGLFTMGHFVMRLLIGRAFVFMIALLFLQMWLIIEKKYKILFAVVVFHILWHQSTYFMPIIIVCMVEASRYLVETKMYWKNIISAGVATIVGMAFFPGFPHSLFASMSNLFAIQSTDVQEVGAKSIAGNELMTKDFMNFFINKEILVLLIVFCLVTVLFLYLLHKENKINTKIIVTKKQLIWIFGLFIFMISTMLGTFVISGRFFDFLFPSLWILFAFIITIIIKIKKVVIDKKLAQFIKIGAVIILFILMTNTFMTVYTQANKFDYTPTRGVAQWIEQNSDGRERVFLTNWALFTSMFFANSHSVYTTGIEPMALKSYDESLYWKYYNIFVNTYYCEKAGDCENELEKKLESVRGNEIKMQAIKKENGRKIIESIKNDFDAKFIISTAPVLTESILLNQDQIEKYASFKSEKFKGSYMDFDVFKLK